MKKSILLLISGLLFCALPVFLTACSGNDGEAEERAQAISDSIRQADGEAADALLDSMIDSLAAETPEEADSTESP